MATTNEISANNGDKITNIMEEVEVTFVTLRMIIFNITMVILKRPYF
jgi:hypothetical protein